MTVWLTGLSGAGKSTLAHALRARLLSLGRPSYVLDGDRLRCGLNAGLGFSKEDRLENVRRTAHAASLLADAGVVAIVACISPHSEARVSARQVHAQVGLPFIEVHVATSIEECRRRDPKGLYARVDAGEIVAFTGIDDPYDVPVNPDLRLDTESRSLDDCVALLMASTGLRPD